MTVRASASSSTRARTARPPTSRATSAATRVPELRVDPLTGLRSIVAIERAARPGGGVAGGGVTPADPIDVENDPFADGHEDRTPPELYAVRANGGPPDSPGWTVRVVPNLYPALDPASPEPPPSANPDLFSAQPARGAHEVIVNGPQSVSSLADLP